MTDRWRFACILQLCVLQLLGCAAGPLPVSHPAPEEPRCVVPVAPKDPAFGDDDALVSAVLFGDPTQPETYHALDEVLALSVREGASRVRAVYKFFPKPGDAEGRRLALASLTVQDLAGNTAFFQFQRLILSGYVKALPAPFSPKQLRDWAEQAGVQDLARFERELAAGKHAQRLSEHSQLARQLDLSNTPVLFANGQRSEGEPQGVITETLERELKRAELRLDSGLPRARLYNLACSENGGRGSGETQAIDSKLSSGLQIRDSLVGKGREALKGDRVVVHYTGRLEDGTVFDSSVSRNTPFEFVIGRKQVIAGWERGLQGMRVGGKRTLVVPHELAYGVRGQPPRIPPRATLTFDIELLEVRAADLESTQ